MFSKTNQSSTLRFKLIITYGGLLTLMTAFGFMLIYFWVSSYLQKITDDALRTEIKEFASIYSKKDGATKIHAEFKEEELCHGNDRVICILYDNKLKKISSSNLVSWQGMSLPSLELLKQNKHKIVIETINVPSRNYPLRRAYSFVNNKHILVYGIYQKDNTKILKTLKIYSCIVLVIIIILGIFVGYYIAGEAVKGLNNISEVMTKVANGDFSTRVQIINEGREIEQLAETFNIMQDKIQSLIQNLKETSIDIAHDMRSPLTRIRGVAENTLVNKNNKTSEYQEALGVIIEECDWLMNVISIVLVISEADSRVSNYQIQEICLNDILTQATDLFTLSAEEKMMQLTLNKPEHKLIIKGDPPHIQRVFSNLLDNAIKYSDAGGKINVNLFTEENMAVIEVKDNGRGVKKEEQKRIFNRFYRGDNSRTTPGNGLGLSFVKSMVKAHEGSISIKSEINRYTLFTIKLPLSKIITT